ncbi:alpha/beta hydrolase family protein [Roseivirga pacifica]|uniref:S9 family peptidase n=1 Tax=Roseivirga pacifica TaxID=1267423 RepID=UPI00227D6C72|nr:S9 family peptidase [Roseivirga pacifica]
MKRLVLLFVLALGFSLNAQVSNKLEMLDIFNLEYISDPQISPDGTKVIYVRNFKDVMTDRNLSNLWITNFDGTAHRPLTTGEQNDRSPRWSHDGSRIVYTSNKSGKSEIYLRWMDSGEEMVLVNSEHTPSNVTWSPDDRYLAFNMFIAEATPSPIPMPKKPKGAVWNAPPKYVDKMNWRRDGAGELPTGNQQLFTVPVSGGTPRQLTEGDNSHSNAVWDKDGKHLYFSANMREDREIEGSDSDIYSLEIATGKLTKLTDRYGPDSNPTISPDGKKIAYTGYDDTYKGYQISKLYIMDIDGSNTKLISGKLDRDVGSLTWAADGKGLYFQYVDKAHTKIAHITTSGKVTDITEGLGGMSLGRPYTSGAYSIAANGNYAYTWAETHLPADLGVGNSGKNKRVTQVNEDLFEYKQLGKVEEIWYKSSADGLDINGWIVTPPNFDPNKKYPLILEIHGGPFSSYGPTFSGEIQLMAAAGYVVLYTNPRGSTSYGANFGNEIDKNYPSHDYDDLMSGVDEVISRGYIDESQLFVTGGSGGGVLTSWIVGKTDRFAAAVVAKPVINWYSWSLNADMSAFATRYWFEKKPWEDPETYMKHSPISLVGNVTTPTMLLTGEADLRTPIHESEQYYNALKLQGVETAMVRIPGAYHGIASRPSNLIAKVSSILMWFGNYSTESVSLDRGK